MCIRINNKKNRVINLNNEINKNSTEPMQILTLLWKLTYGIMNGYSINMFIIEIKCLEEYIWETNLFQK